MFCRSCGKRIDNYDNYCIYCGQKVYIFDESIKKTNTLTYSSYNPNILKTNSKKWGIILIIISLILVFLNVFRILFWQ